jgi:DNA-binding PucR family transcriptional regulator
MIASSAENDALMRARAVGHDVRFSDDWLLCVLAVPAERLAPMFTVALDVAREHPSWAKTVLAYAASELSVTAAAHRVHVHSTVRSTGYSGGRPSPGGIPTRSWAWLRP